jgi:hypothetical protein
MSGFVFSSCVETQTKVHSAVELREREKDLFDLPMSRVGRCSWLPAYLLRGLLSVSDDKPVSEEKIIARYCRRAVWRRAESLCDARLLRALIVCRTSYSARPTKTY